MRSSAQVTAKNLERTTTQLFRWQIAQNRPKMVLHDGPPYANGDLHMGHALNKVLKDIINRHAVNSGFSVAYVPGWDCHGLPIEHAALKKVKHRGRDLPAVQRRSLARILALSMVARQQAAFKGFGVMADWPEGDTSAEGKRYLTLSPDYVVRELRVFEQLVAKGLVFRERKPVFWSVESGTALAESELVYGERENIAAYVAYKLTKPLKGFEASLSVWTTTPWTLPANQAIAVNPSLVYAIVKAKRRNLVVAKALLPSFRKIMGEGEVHGTITGKELVGLTYNCPLRGHVLPIIDADHVVDSAGTGLVHTAPGHGKEDFVAGQHHKLPTASPVDGMGKYTTDVEPCSLIGLDARTEGSEAVLNHLLSSDSLLFTHKITHSVPLDWRSKTPVLVRATPQFFIDVGHEVRQLALKALDSVSFRPEAGKQRLQAFTNSRTDWCISRQRAWGVPIPVLFSEIGEPLLSAEALNHVIAVIEKQGVESWFETETDVEAWLPPSLQHQGLGTKYTKCQDTLDVWLDSGSSWTMLDSLPADIYLEGSDQHRGWFQSSLLTHVAVTGEAKAPFKRLITHGFVLDENRQKMSKSLGNTVEPEKLIKTFGVDGLRLLIAQSDYTSDISLSSTVVSQVAATIKKFRLTFKFLLGNLRESTPKSEELSELSLLDKHALFKLNELTKSSKIAYDDQNFQNVIKLVQAHMNFELSSLYFGAVKDVLYADKLDSSRRKAVTFVLHEILSAYVKLLAPILPLLTQEVWDLCPPSITHNQSSPLIVGFPTLSLFSGLEEASCIVARHLQIRDLVNDAIEKARADKKVGSSLACDVFISSSTDYNVDLLETVCVASKVRFGEPSPTEWVYVSEDASTKVSVVPPSSQKCPRCWKYTSTGFHDIETPQEEARLCNRCEDAVEVHCGG